MDVRVSKVGDGRIRKFVGNKWFNLNRDERIAKIQAAALVNEWERLRLLGSPDWPSEVTADPRGFLERLVPLTVPAVRPITITSPITATEVPRVVSGAAKPAPDPRFDGLMFHEALDQYLEFVGESYRSKQIGEEHFFHQHERLKAVKANIPDQLLMGIGYEQLMKIKAFYTTRPTSKRTGEPISIAHVVNTLQTLNMAFKWFDKTDRWEPPRHFSECLTVTGKLKRSLMTPDEQRKLRVPKPTFTMEELGILWKVAWPWARMYLLMGLTLGWTQKEIATLQKGDVVEKDGETYIDRVRHKTGVQGYWWVCPELATLLGERIAKTPDNSGNLALLNENGLPLVHRSRAQKQRRTDNVALLWGRLMKHARKQGVRNFGFSRLRKTGAQMVENLSSLELAKVFMAHAGASVAEKHYITRGGNPEVGMTQFAKLENALRSLHKELKPMFGNASDTAAKRSESITKSTSEAA